MIQLSVSIVLISIFSISANSYYVPANGDDWTILKPPCSKLKGSFDSLPFPFGIVVNPYIINEDGELLEPELTSIERSITTSFITSIITKAPKPTITSNNIAVQIQDGQVQKFNQEEKKKKRDVLEENEDQTLESLKKDIEQEQDNIGIQNHHGHKHKKHFKRFRKNKNKNKDKNKDDYEKNYHEDEKYDDKYNDDKHYDDFNDKHGNYDDDKHYDDGKYHDDEHYDDGKYHDDKHYDDGKYHDDKHYDDDKHYEDGKYHDDYKDDGKYHDDYKDKHGYYDDDKYHDKYEDDKTHKYYDEEFQSPIYSVACYTNATLKMRLKDSILTDSDDRIGCIVQGHQWQFDGPTPQHGAVYAAGWYVTKQGQLALGNSTKFYQCASGNFYNLYDEPIGYQCHPVTLDVVELIEC